MLEFKMIDNLLDSLKKYKKITSIISAVRLFLLLVLVIEFILLFSLKEYLIYGIIIFITLIIFLLFIILTNKYYKYYESLMDKDKCYKTHLNRRELKLNSFNDLGEDFKNKNDYKISDLDLFGRNSLYQYLTSAKTKKGRILLANQLTNPKEMSEDFSLMVNEFAKNEDSIDIEASLYHFKNTKKVNHDELMSVSKNKIKFKITHILPLLSFLGMVSYAILVLLLGLNPFILIIFLITNLFFCKIFLQNEIFKLDGGMYQDTSNAYLYVSNVIINNKISTKRFDEIKNNLSNEVIYIKKLKSIYGLFNLKKNAIIDVILNTLFISDFWLILYYNINTLKVSNIKNTFDDIAEVEVALSLANVGIDNNIYTLPLKDTIIDVEEMYHPLIKNCVPNDIKFDHGIILTGSNMSGKTTFMRTLAINEILYMAGGLCLAKSFKAPRLKVLTSLRANDMLNEGISTFYAEILRMKEMMKYYNEERCLILVDEIFKGTNTNDRVNASAKVIKKLLDSDTIFIISTHDFELSKEEGIKNYHFNEEYIDDKITFDYKIKNGVSDTTNAIYLLKMADII